MKVSEALGVHALLQVRAVVMDLGRKRGRGLRFSHRRAQTLREQRPQQRRGRVQGDKRAERVEQDARVYATHRHVANSTVNRPSSTAIEHSAGTVMRRRSTNCAPQMNSGKMTSS